VLDFVPKNSKNFQREIWYNFEVDGAALLKYASLNVILKPSFNFKGGETPPYL
jgi:hypothetical protein